MTIDVDSTNRSSIDDPAEPASDLSRRRALRNTIAAVGLAATMGRTGSGASGGAAAPQPGVHHLSLHTDTLSAPSRAVLQPGQSSSTAALLAGDAEGHLVSTLTALTDAWGAPAYLNEQQVITLADATLVGAGVRPLGADTAVYAIIGGTGRYLGARGEYTVVGSHAANGGSGSATYRFTIIVDDHVDTASPAPTTRQGH